MNPADCATLKNGPRSSVASSESATRQKRFPDLPNFNFAMFTPSGSSKPHKSTEFVRKSSSSELTRGIWRFLTSLDSRDHGRMRCSAAPDWKIGGFAALRQPHDPSALKLKVSSVSQSQQQKGKHSGAAFQSENKQKSDSESLWTSVIESTSAVFGIGEKLRQPLSQTPRGMDGHRCRGEENRNATWKLRVCASRSCEMNSFLWKSRGFLMCLWGDSGEFDRSGKFERIDHQSPLDMTLRLP
jgi:hypothetical protein